MNLKTICVNKKWHFFGLAKNAISNIRAEYQLCFASIDLQKNDFILVSKYTIDKEIKSSVLNYVVPRSYAARHTNDTKLLVPIIQSWSKTNFTLIIFDLVINFQLNCENHPKYLIKVLMHLKPRVYVRPCTKYPTHGIKACVAKQGDTKI
ncbi:hypothetical protein BpHYR1_010878 [Brachionus plicatilis]|uniref:Uncharacterized protein n=1 Tax=Brachionus plicatilis TaxID=10195 RepID=A0A3M7QNW1_BRAPC|nr:hypothetical protein BpHYR1_010878 [Brachionus plicatilis]